MSRGVMTTRPVVIDRGGGACEESQAPFLRYRGIPPNPNMSFSLAQRKELKETFPQPRPSPKGRMQKNFRRDRRKILGFGIAGRRDEFFIGLRHESEARP